MRTIKMKLLKFFSFVLICNSYFSQTTENITFKVTNYSVNGIKFDNLADNSDLALTFYTCGDSSICFAKIFRKDDSQSYGAIFGINYTKYKETEKEYAYDQHQFTWNFSNTFNNAKGKATVTLKEIFIGETVKMTAEIIILETNEILLFKGYLEK